MSLIAALLIAATFASCFIDHGDPGQSDDFLHADGGASGGDGDGGEADP